MHVLTPVNLAEAQSNMAEYTVSGFPGCVGSSDLTSQQRDVSTTLKTTILVGRVVILLARLI